MQCLSCFLFHLLFSAHIPPIRLYQKSNRYQKKYHNRISELSERMLPIGVFYNVKYSFLFSFLLTRFHMTLLYSIGVIPV